MAFNDIILVQETTPGFIGRTITPSASGLLGFNSLGQPVAYTSEQVSQSFSDQTLNTTSSVVFASASATTIRAASAVYDGIGDIRILPQNSQSAAYTLVFADAGKHILHPSADTTARTFTIPGNATVPWPVGTAVTFVNQNGAGTITIAITSDTMRLAGAGTTGSRTLAANGVATAIKITSTEWIISGTGLT
jgi:hypothetical protein